MNNLVFILQGLKITILVWSFTLIFSIPFSLLTVFEIWKFDRIFKKIVNIFTWVIRSTPLLLQLFFIYYGLGMIGISISATVSAFLAFTINYTAYFIVIFQDAFFHNSIDQIEAGLALGLSKSVIFKKILLPQAIQKSIGVLSNETLTLLKDTALVSTIGLADVLRNAKEIVTREFIISPFIITFFIYLMLSTIIVIIFNKIKQKRNII